MSLSSFTSSLPTDTTQTPNGRYLVEKISFTQAQAFSPLFLDFMERAKAVRPFYHRGSEIADFAAQIEEKKRDFSAEKRQVLVETLQKQYQGLPNAPTELIAALKDENTFTVTTGHQLNIYSGTLYFHYKILTVIALAQKLAAAFPQYRFIPLYWQASEDHDLAEIQSIEVFGKTYTWQTSQKGAVGRMHTEGLEQVGQAILSDFQGISQAQLEPYWSAYQNAPTLAKATQAYVHALYGQKGLLVLDADERELKRLFVPYLQEDLFEQVAEQRVGKQTADLLEANDRGDRNYKAQIHAHAVNLFYMEGQIRERIVKDQDEAGKPIFKVRNTDLVFSKAEIEQLLHHNPERFSPNVVLRPLYQEVILPNLSYTGGPGEFAYWLQLKSLFDSSQIPFPILVPRNFALIVPKHQVSRKEKLGISWAELFLDMDTLRIQFVANQAAELLDFSQEEANLNQLFEAIKTKAEAIDKSLGGFVAAEAQKTLKSLDNIAKRLRKAEESRQQVAIKQLEGLKEKLFPKGNLQERVENILSFSLNQPDFLAEIGAELDPFAPFFYIFAEQNSEPQNSSPDVKS
ncbi:bacillithiol biosynthesis cysteine-adding enzyme BshC [Hugenholtzia roseola]|uniref:bacillithiol biosynthesis cysteine-adding enzyme BshC n=1 Tax=Hugenholtzia roseola TaxID=1002 RepID=UPI0006884ACB|nr:bacillithiol biosynthesis cysteine-adding enzyme BshC [Hugenholtzia roseola]